MNLIELATPVKCRPCGTSWTRQVVEKDREGREFVECHVCHRRYYRVGWSARWSDSTDRQSAVFHVYMMTA